MVGIDRDMAAWPVRDAGSPDVLCARQVDSARREDGGATGPHEIQERELGLTVRLDGAVPLEVVDPEVRDGGDVDLAKRTVRREVLQLVRRELEHDDVAGPERDELVEE